VADYIIQQVILKPSTHPGSGLSIVDARVFASRSDIWRVGGYDLVKEDMFYG